MEINRNVLLPNLVTVGNGVCGFAALTTLFKVNLAPDPQGHIDPVSLAAFSNAAWLVLLGMVFDVFDGKVARLSGGASALGAQLDSLCDLITFGLVPAVMILCLSAGYPPTSWHRWSWFFSLSYFLGALLRLARFTAENVPDETAHVAFKGLPSPGAAGCVASLVLFYSYLGEWKAFELRWLSEHFIDPNSVQRVAQASLPVLLPLLGLVLGFTMVSNRLRFVHFGTWFFHRRHSFDFFAYLIFGGILVALVPEVLLPMLFCGYLAYTPFLYVVHYFLPRKAAASPVPDEWKPS